MTTQLKFTVDDHLEERLSREQRRRGSKTLARTVRDLMIERLTQIEMPAPEPRGDEQEKTSPATVQANG